jgi:peptidoglycan/LPS O-acetylase OafA/YrhL
MISIYKGGSASGALDLIRFFAALVVLLGHGVPRFFGYFDADSHQGLSEKLFRVIFSGYGSHGVTIFFILSGLFIGYSVINQINNNTFSWKSYLGRRVIRLWIVLLPALVLTAILDHIGLEYFYDDIMYSDGDVEGSLNGSTNSILGFLGNAFFVQTILVPVFGSNHALWSLANEFWYYILFPLCMFALINKNKLSLLIGFSTLIIIICAFIGSNIYIYYFIWLIGVLAIYMPKKKLFCFKYASFWSLLVFIIALVALRVAPLFEDKITERLLVSIPFFFLLLTLIFNHKNLDAESSYSIASKNLAGFSYTLYCVHTPIMSLIRGIVIGDDGFWEFNLMNMSLYMLIVVFTVLVSYLISLMTEAHTSKVYKAFKV